MPDFACHPHPGPWIAKPLHSFQHATQYLVIGRLHIKRQSDHKVNNHLGRKISLAKPGLALPGQHRTNGRIRKGLADDAKTDVVRNPHTREKFRNRRCQLWPPVPASDRIPKICLSEQY